MATRPFGPSALATPANAITIARLVLTPVWLLVVLAEGATWGSFSLGFVLAASDGVDGYLARRQGTTRSGAFLDPLADKFLVVGGLLALVALGVFWWLPVVLITFREIAISVFRSILGRRGISVPARYWAKVKTVVEEFAIAFALFPPTAGTEVIGKTVLWVAVAFATVTGAQYLFDGQKLVRSAA